MNVESRPVLARLQIAGVIAAVLGLIGCALAFGQDAKVFQQSYLFGFVFWYNLSLGCLGVSLLHHSIRARWSLPVLRFFEAGSSLLPYILLLFIPVLLWLPNLYPWAAPDAAAHDAVIRFKSPYLNSTRFILFAIGYFVVWIGLASILNRSSAAQESSGNATLAQGRANLGAAGLVLYVLTVTFATTDWVMSLDPHWYSTVYGVMFVVAQGYGALALATVMLGLFGKHKPVSDELTPRLTRDLGNMLLTFTMLWAYIAFSQYVIMYSGNLPEEITYYTARLQGTWWAIGTGLVIFQFFVPFLLLLSGRTKRTPSLIVSVAVWILLMRVVDTFWVVTPFFYGDGGAVPAVAYWGSASTLLAMGGIWLLLYAHRLGRYPLVARHQTLSEEVPQHVG